MAKSAQHTGPVMSATARLHYDRGGWMPGHERAKRLPRQLALKPNLAVHRRPVNLENRLCRSEEHTSELQSLMRISYAVVCLKKKKRNTQQMDKHELEYRITEITKQNSKNKIRTHKNNKQITKEDNIN